MDAAMNEDDEVEAKRRFLVGAINDNPRSRQELEAVAGQVWDTTQLQADFEVLAFFAPFVAVRRKVDGKKGALAFQHMPRFYFEFIESES